MNLKDYPVVTVEQVNRFRGKALTEIYRLQHLHDTCICKGNWKLLVTKYQEDIDKTYLDKDGNKFIFVGIMWGKEDSYFVLHGIDTPHKTIYVSCEGSLEGYETV